MNSGRSTRTSRGHKEDPGIGKVLVQQLARRVNHEYQKNVLQPRMLEEMARRKAQDTAVKCPECGTVIAYVPRNLEWWALNSSASTDEVLGCAGCGRCHQLKPLIRVEGTQEKPKHVLQTLTCCRLAAARPLLGQPLPAPVRLNGHDRRAQRVGGSRRRA